jgi:hypothetical protein
VEAQVTKVNASSGNTHAANWEVVDYLLRSDQQVLSFSNRLVVACTSKYFHLAIVWLLVPSSTSI